MEGESVSMDEKNAYLSGNRTRYNWTAPISLYINHY